MSLKINKRINPDSIMDLSVEPAKKKLLSNYYYKGITLGKPEYLNKLGIHLAKGDFGNGLKELAQEYFILATKKGYTDSSFELAMLKLKQASESLDFTECIKYLVESVKNGHEESRLFLMKLCKKEYAGNQLLLVVKDYAEQNEVWALLILGDIHSGLYTNENDLFQIDEALKWYERAVDLNSFEAILNIISIHMKKNVNFDLILKCCIKALYHPCFNDLESKESIVTVYKILDCISDICEKKTEYNFEKIGGSGIIVESIITELIKVADEFSNDYIYELLGKLYSDDIVVKKNDTEAFGFYYKGAELGNTLCQYNVGIM
jgi:TPR repeat protein